jgi:ABC-type antimicrobial peptide transport system permease subunit
MEQRIAQNYWFLALFGTFFAIFAAVAVLLAAVGVCGVVAHAVSRRTQEIGVRMALGASSRAVLKLVFIQGMRPVVLGLIAGLGAALVATRFLRILIRVSPTDPATFAAASAVLMALAALGCAVPAWRATRIQPMSVLRPD